MTNTSLDSRLGIMIPMATFKNMASGLLRHHVKTFNACCYRVILQHFVHKYSLLVLILF